MKFHNLQLKSVVAAGLAISLLGGVTPAFASERSTTVSEPASDWEWAEISCDKGIYDKKPIEDLKSSLTVDTNEMYGVENRFPFLISNDYNK